MALRRWRSAQCRVVWRGGGVQLLSDEEPVGVWRCGDGDNVRRDRQRAAALAAVAWRHAALLPRRGGLELKDGCGPGRGAGREAEAHRALEPGAAREGAALRRTVPRGKDRGGGG